MVRRLTVTTTEGGWRADVFVARHLDMSRNQVQKLFSDGCVLSTDRPIKAGARLETGQLLLVDVPPASRLDLQPVAMALSVVHEDADLIVLDKPRGLVVHPGNGTIEPTLVHGLLARWQGSLSAIGGVERPGIVHRLDKDTSGLLIVARTDKAHRRLSEAFATGRVHKTYLALADGRLEHAVLNIDRPVGRHPRERHKMAVVPGGRSAVTRVELIQAFAAHSYLRALPRTGRTHQIRVHLKSIGHPIVGDPLYGRPSPLLDGQFLHAARLQFDHPITGQGLSFEAPLPDSLRQVLAAVCGTSTAGGWD